MSEEDKNGFYAWALFVTVGVLLFFLNHLSEVSLYGYQEECIESHVEEHIIWSSSGVNMTITQNDTTYVFTDRQVNATKVKTVCDKYALVRNATEDGE